MKESNNGCFAATNHGDYYTMYINGDYVGTFPSVRVRHNWRDKLADKIHKLAEWIR